MTVNLLQPFALCAAVVAAAIASDPACAQAPPPADTVLRNGNIATLDAHDTLAQSIAIRAGRIVYVGADAGVKAFIGGNTQVTDLHGRMLMPGLVDGHMHPLGGGAALMSCNLDYAPLTTKQFLARIQACLDASRDQEPSTWLHVTGWYRQFMRPPGTDASAATLDTLKTERPIAVESTDGHTLVANSHGLILAGINKDTPDVADGRIVRDAIAHAELVDPADYGRFAKLDVIPVMSFQWAKPGPDSIDATRDYLGPERFARMEPEGSLYAAHARIAYGSDWPVDKLGEWFAIKVGVTRTGDPALGKRYAGRLNAEKGLPREFALRSITMNSSYELHQEADTGSLEAGKLADLIVLDRNVLTVPAEDIAGTRVLMTMVGGKLVYQAKGF